MSNHDITDRHVDEFHRALEIVRPLMRAGGLQSERTSVQVPAWQQYDLHKLSAELAKTTKSIFERAGKLRDKMQDEWKENPRLCNASLLGPLALRNKEVPLTHAIAWLLAPQADGAPLHLALLAALLELVLDRRVSTSDVSGWQVDAEKSFENSSDRSRVDAEKSFEKYDGRSRVDIYMEGLIYSKMYRIAIEAKVNAPEGKRQLEKYETALRRRASEIEKEHEHEIHVVFLTRPGRSCRSSKTAKSVSYADVLNKWLPVLRHFPSEPATPFARLLMADIARDLADMHIGDQLSGRHGLPMFVDEHMQVTAENKNG